MDLHVFRHLINPCGVPGWTGTEKGHHMNAYTTVSDSNITVRATSEPAAGIFDTAENPANGAGNQRLIGIRSSLTGGAPLYPYVLSRNSGLYAHTLFNKAPEELRRLGARGGRVSGRNRRLRLALIPTPPPPTLSAAIAREATSAAITALDAQFPWLRRAEKRHRNSE
jgi:hypothetical protein